VMTIISSLSSPSVDLSHCQLRNGQMTRRSVSFAHRFSAIAANSFSLVYGEDKSLDLITSPEQFSIWYHGIEQILLENYLRHSPAMCSYTAIYSWYSLSAWSPQLRQGP
jgi:hypothetical protein